MTDKFSLKSEDVDLDQLIKDVRAWAKRFPDFVYEQEAGECKYHPTERNAYGCLIGAGLSDQGIDTVNMENSPIWEMFTEEEAELPKNAWLISVQESQDDYVPWGKAVEMADRNHPL